MPERTAGSLNRDDEQKPGRPPRSAYEPKGAEESVQTDKTMTDPASGEQKARPPEPGASDRADADRQGPGREN